MRDLDRKLATIAEGRYTPDDFVIADAKDADMSGGVPAAGPFGLRRDDPVDERLDRGALLGGEIFPRAWCHRRGRLARVRVPGHPAGRFRRRAGRGKRGGGGEQRAAPEQHRITI